MDKIEEAKASSQPQLFCSFVHFVSLVKCYHFDFHANINRIFERIKNQHDFLLRDGCIGA